MVGSRFYLTAAMPLQETLLQSCMHRFRFPTDQLPPRGKWSPWQEFHEFHFDEFSLPVDISLCLSSAQIQFSVRRDILVTDSLKEISSKQKDLKKKLKVKIYIYTLYTVQ